MGFPTIYMQSHLWVGLKVWILQVRKCGGNHFPCGHLGKYIVINYHIPIGPPEEIRILTLSNDAICDR